MKLYPLIIVFIFATTLCANAQSTIISGKITEKESGQILIGANLIIQNTFTGTSTNKEGEFRLETTIKPPFEIIVSSIGFKKQQISISESFTVLNIVMEEDVLVGREIVVSASKIEEKLLESSVSIEKIDIVKLQQTTSTNFYDGLYNLKGVDMNVQSLTFRVPNTRGFNGNTNYRFGQYVDGVENIAAGLSFAAGNIIGLSQIDVESVELLVGASSAIYGAGGMNGTLLMTSQNPYEYQGLSTSLQTGIMHLGADYRDNPAPMVDFSFRYAQSVNDRFAFKVTGSYLRASDWQGVDYRDRNDLDNPNSTRENNPGYDGVNVYGDDIIVPVNLREVAPGIAAGIAETIGLDPSDPRYDNFIDSVTMIFPDQVISRTGWIEDDLVDSKTENLRVSTSLHYRFKNKWEAILSGGYAIGTSVYTAQNRFSLDGFSAIQGKLEIKSPDFYIRVWGLKENAGDTYDAGTTALLMNEAWKPSAEWYTDYIQSFTQSFLLGTSESLSHVFGRLVADNRSLQGVIFNPREPAIPLAGTSEFETIFNDITSKPLGQGGTKVIDKTGMINLEGMYNFKNLISSFELIVGANYRLTNINSEGTAFFDTPGDPILVFQVGGFAQIAKSVFNDRLKFTLSGRYDAHEKFEGRATPRFSLVYAIDPFKVHNFRASAQTAFRFPSTADQWVDLDVGQFKVIGGLPEVHAKYGLDTTNVFPLTGPNPITDKPYLDDGPFVIPPFRPEEVTAFEVGYRGLYLKGKMFVDAYIYQNQYSGFLATQLLVQFPNTPQEQRYQTFVSTDSEVTSSGWAIGTDYRFETGYFITGNIAYNSLNKIDAQPGFLTQYNTPDYRLNLGVGKRNFLKDISFNVNGRWQNSFLWESTFGVGTIPAYFTLDAQVSYKVKSMKSLFKVGGSNIINNYYTTGFGNAAIGGLYYITWSFDSMMN